MMKCTLVLLLTTAIHYTDQHGRMFEPPARNTMWRMGFETHANYEDSELFCGGISGQWHENNGKCGICGDSYSLKPPRPYEAGGKYSTGIVTRKYPPGSEIDVVIDLVANHLGYFEFGLCPKQSADEAETEECFIPLTVNDSHRYWLNTHRKGFFNIPVQLPKGLQCSHCVLRWHWKSANNWGACLDGKHGLGCGPQETYRNCADIEVSHEQGIRGKENEIPRQVKPKRQHQQQWAKLVLGDYEPHDDHYTFHVFNFTTQD